MPELPEVETVRNSLKKLIIGCKINNVIVIYDGIIKGLSKDEFKQKLINQTLKDIRRKGKYLLFDFNQITLTSHLRMEGKYFIRHTLKDLTKHDHIIFEIDNSKYLTYHDVRKFGTMEITDLHKETSLRSIQVLGPDVNSDELNTEYLYSKTRQSNKPIKSLLLDQHIIAGLGNIYVDETLFLAKVHSSKPAKELNILIVDKIVKSAKKVIDEAIDLGGTTIRSYQSSLGVDGRFQQKLMVHTLVNQPCKQCGDIILKTKVGGRGTYYCPTCQKESSTIILGLTGGIASGKSFVSDYFTKQHIKVLDADKIYKDLLKTNKIMYNEIAQTFGEDVITNGHINRITLGKIVFNDSKKLKTLNRLTHPFVLEAINKEIKKLTDLKEKIIVLDIPLLFEAKMDYLANLTMLVYVDSQTQIKRLMERDKCDKELALKKINSQMSLDAKIELSDIIINNDKSTEETIKQLDQILKQLRSE